MRIIMKGVRCSLDDKLKKYIREKLVKFSDILPASSLADVMCEEKKAHRRGGHHAVHIKITIPGYKKRYIFAKKGSADFYSAIDLVEPKIERQIAKYRIWTEGGGRISRRRQAKDAVFSALGFPYRIFGRLKRGRK